MGKTLAVILHYNSVQYTDPLYESLKPYEGNDYDLVIVDNGSDEKKQSRYEFIPTGTNVYFGGGLFCTFDYFLDRDEYDSLLFLNSDLVIDKSRLLRYHFELDEDEWNSKNGMIDERTFVSGLRKELADGFEIVSPSILQPGLIQNHWQQMWNWNSHQTREVQWIDLQAPLMSRKFIEHIVQHKEKLLPDLMFGWGLEIFFGIECQNQKWKIGVCDHILAGHLGSATIKDNLSNPTIANYCPRAEINQLEFFMKKGLKADWDNMRKWGETYTQYK